VSHEHHLSRKELKTDQIRETIVHGAEAALSHQKQLWIFGGGLLAVVLLVFGWRFYSERQNMKAWAGFEEANKVFQARIRGAGEAEQPDEVSFFDEKIKFEEAAKKYAALAGQFSRTRAGRLAKYYAGLSYGRIAKYDEAQNWLKQAASAGDAELAALSRYQQAQILEKTGKGDEAVKMYQALLTAPSTMVPKPLVMLTLADYYRKANPAEAQKLYTQIRTEFPESEAARRAQERLEMMGQS
jgi:tetratricopeptide (TPR) repeat protein